MTPEPVVKAPERRLPRISDPASRRQLRVVGVSRAGWQELYYFLLSAPWTKLLGLIALAYVALNSIFALGYLAVGGINGARPGSFVDAFFFSVQTFSTIGYGHLYPESTAANVVVMGESLVGLVVVAMFTGLAFAKFARPRARVMFSRVAVVSVRDGRTTLMLRVANERRNHIAEAQCRLSLVRTEFTKEGERVRRVHDLPLQRSQQPTFQLSWTVLHTIDEHSPLFGVSAETLHAVDAQVLASIIGHDEVLGQTVHARHAYLAEEVVWNRRFVDVFGRDAEGRSVIDYSRFHDTADEG